MLLLRSVSELPGTNADLQSAFRAKWGRENTVVWFRSRHAELGPYTHTLSINATWGGVKYCHVDGRAIAVDDDNFLILNHGRIYATSIHSDQPVESLAICFSPELVEQVYGAAVVKIEQALERGDSAVEHTPDFLENLQSNERRVSPVLRFIRAHLRDGLADHDWYEEQLVFLLARLQAHRDAVLEQIDRLAFIRPRTRREVFRRIGFATDFIHTNYEHDVDLSTLAKMAYLSKYHFLRLFTAMHGITPHHFLQRKRVSVAARLLERTGLSVSEIAARVGFSHESTLLRQVRRWKNTTPQQIRLQSQGRLLPAADTA